MLHKIQLLSPFAFPAEIPQPQRLRGDGPFPFVHFILPEKYKIRQTKNAWNALHPLDEKVIVNSLKNERYICILRYIHLKPKKEKGG
jgi:hypothetical protein